MEMGCAVFGGVSGGLTSPVGSLLIVVRVKKELFLGDGVLAGRSVFVLPMAQGLWSPQTGEPLGRRVFQGRNPRCLLAPPAGDRGFCPGATGWAG